MPARDSDPRAADGQRTMVARSLLGLQRSAGNAAVQRVLRGTSRPARLAAIDRRERDAPTEVVVARAGTPEAQAAPDGLDGILDSASSLGFTGGWTGIRSAAAFTAPTVATVNELERVPAEGRDHPVTRHFAVFAPTRPVDATHDSMYPEPGIHHVPRLGRHYRISAAISQLIRRGEQEHLSDARRAYDLTYGRIGQVVNRLARRGVRFGPASTPAAATQRAMSHLERLLGPLTTSPGRWRELLDQLLPKSARRDTRGWHYLDTQLSRHRGRPVHDVVEGPTTRIGVPADEVVDLPS